MRILITGGTGFIGSLVCQKLISKGHEVVLLVRGNKKLPPEMDLQGILTYPYDFKPDSKIPLDLMEKIDGVINMAGEPIFSGRWTEEKKQRIVDSRINITRQIVESFSLLKEKKPQSFVSASAVGYYGPRNDENIYEDEPAGTDFLSQLAVNWEQEALEAVSSGVRTVVLRTGIVLDKGGGALAKMIPPYKFFVGGPLGSGKQYVSWIHREDMANIYIDALLDPKWNGPINATAPNPVTMKDLGKTIGKVLRRPSWFPVPSFLLKMMIGESSQVILTGQKVIPKKLQDLSYPFQYPDIYEAMVHIVPS